ncbi:acyl-CoA N-acyltransferase [Chaetomidium leptoderma]|uniref:Acyl-CoA N-acyltransferase n=1 Tax=Chaetomidium leptoderma TaxID=669021 RepID=A0AAN6VHX9_9PEZI|nr:acyl-CoA N-acyltransferase [Chaetomidium leptoderma]
MATWRPMTENDIAGVMRVADEIHRDLPEHEAVLRERLKLFPQGCMVLVDAEDVGGYVVSFPICRGKPPALNDMLGEIPLDADQYYLHDLAILPRFRGRGAAAECVREILRVAGRYSTTCLISVYGTVPFWGRFGFAPEVVDMGMEEKLRGYGADATYLTRQNT